MTDLYLIAHKVRGEPAFDVATRMECPLCQGAGYDQMEEELCGSCHECDGLGYWWIVPTSGHRAYPWWDMELETLFDRAQLGEWWGESVPTMPPDLPDHYAHTSAPKVSLVDALGLAKPKPLPPIVRRL